MVAAMSYVLTQQYFAHTFCQVAVFSKSMSIGSDMEACPQFDSEAIETLILYFDVTSN